MIFIHLAVVAALQNFADQALGAHNHHDGSFRAALLGVTREGRHQIDLARFPFADAFELNQRIIHALAIVDAAVKLQPLGAVEHAIGRPSMAMIVNPPVATRCAHDGVDDEVVIRIFVEQ